MRQASGHNKTDMAVVKEDAASIARAHAIYTPFALSFYDTLVHGLSNRLAWGCPTSKLIDLYRHNLSLDHLEAAVGTGFFIDHAACTFDRLVLLDINTNCLDRAAKRLHRFRPECLQANLLSPLPYDCAPFRSVGLTYALHCLPGSMTEKLKAVDHLMPVMGTDAVLFGATILGAGVHPNGPARVLLNVYNKKGVFNNRADDLQALTEGLNRRFEHVEIAQHGLVALFRAH